MLGFRRGRAALANTTSFGCPAIMPAQPTKGPITRTDYCSRIKVEVPLDSECSSQILEHNFRIGIIRVEEIPPCIEGVWPVIRRVRQTKLR